ncbi:hypothetical protein [Martelella alba]|uniref:hypothetical protein n=1 Tax=Martelella alba TaxID=2590451 RepID=UPI0015E82C73|nr:hypothetical protein [Martelella alba]
MNRLHINAGQAGRMLEERPIRPEITAHGGRIIAAKMEAPSFIFSVITFVPGHS